MIALWIATALLAVVYVGAGLLKTITPYEKLYVRDNFAWARDFTPRSIRALGIAELVGVIGLILPASTGIVPWLTPVSAIAFVFVQIGAIGVHVKHGERKGLPTNIVLLILGALVTVGWILV